MSVRNARKSFTFTILVPTGIARCAQELGGLRGWIRPVRWSCHGHSRPRQVLGYLARYLTGGPIADHRIIRDEDGRVTFWARGKDKARGNGPRPFSLPGKELVRRWSMHILPKGYTRSRQYGGYHGKKRAAYLAACRQMLSLPVRSELQLTEGQTEGQTPYFYKSRSSKGQTPYFYNSRTRRQDPVCE